MRREDAIGENLGNDGDIGMFSGLASEDDSHFVIGAFECRESLDARGCWRGWLGYALVFRCSVVIAVEHVWMVSF